MYNEGNIEQATRMAEARADAHEREIDRLLGKPTRQMMVMKVIIAILSGVIMALFTMIICAGGCGAIIQGW